MWTVPSLVCSWQGSPGFQPRQWAQQATRIDSRPHPRVSFLLSGLQGAPRRAASGLSLMELGPTGCPKDGSAAPEVSPSIPTQAPGPHFRSPDCGKRPSLPSLRPHAGLLCRLPLAHCPSLGHCFYVGSWWELLSPGSFTIPGVPQLRSARKEPQCPPGEGGRPQPHQASHWEARTCPPTSRGAVAWARPPALAAALRCAEPRTFRSSNATGQWMV